MALKTDIVNMALANLGRYAVADTQTDEKALVLINIHYDNALDDLLRSHPWGFAFRHERLAELDMAAADDSRLRLYAYPADCVMVRRVYGEGCVGRGRRFSVGFHAGRKVVRAEARPPAFADYTSRLPEAAEYDAKFANALSWRLAASVAYGLHNDPQAHQAAMQTYLLALRDAAAADGIEATLPDLPDGPYVEARNI